MMIPLALTVLAIFLLLCVSELLWRTRLINPEYSRKFIHISVGTFVAFWPLFLDRLSILLLCLAFVAAVAITKYFKIFKAIHSVQRPTWGEVFFALAVGVLALTAQTGWIYLVALLHMSLADGLAAIVGTTYGRKNEYRIFGQTKSVVGTLTFVVVSTAILCGYALFTPDNFSLWFFPITLGAAAIENTALLGLDNLLVPLLVALALNVVR